MKVLVVLALALFSVCNADVQSQGAPIISLEQLEEGLQGYCTGVVFIAADSWKEFRKTELGQNVNTWISQSAKSAEQYIHAMVSPDFMTQLTQEAEQLRRGLTTSLQPLAEDLTDKLRTMVEAMIPRTKSLQEQLTQKTQEIQERLIPYRDGVKSKFDSFHYPRIMVSKASTHQLFLPSLLIVYLFK